MMLAAPAGRRVSQDSQQTHPAFEAQAAAGSTAVENGSFHPFLLEEWQSRWEFDVECNLADSGVKAVTVEELVSTPEALQASIETSKHHHCHIPRSTCTSCTRMRRPLQAILTAGAHAHRRCLLVLSSMIGRRWWCAWRQTSPCAQGPQQASETLFRATQALLKTSLGYPPVAGTPELQALVAKWHGAQPDDVLVTVGCSEVHA